MKIFLLVLIAITLVYCQTTAQDIDRLDLLVPRYKNGYNYAQWGDYKNMFAKDLQLGGHNMPLIKGNSEWVDACSVLYPTGIRLGMHGEELNFKKNIGVITGYYTYYYIGSEQKIDEIGYFQAFLKKQENGQWKFDNLQFNILDHEYGICAEWWRQNL